MTLHKDNCGGRASRLYRARAASLDASKVPRGRDDERAFGEISLTMTQLRAPASQVMGARLIVAMMLASVVASCDECREYSAFTCRQIESADYNVYFYYPSGTERYLGRVNGLPQCGRAAHGFAASQNLSGKEWGYVCCMIARGSDCYEKHR